MLPESPNRPRALLAADAGRSRESRGGACCRHGSGRVAGTGLAPRARAGLPSAGHGPTARGARNSLSGAEHPAAHRHRGHRELSAPAKAPLITAAIALPAPSCPAPGAALGGPGAGPQWHPVLPPAPALPWPQRSPRGRAGAGSALRHHAAGGTFPPWLTELWRVRPPGTGVPAGGTGQDSPGGWWHGGRGACCPPAAAEAAGLCCPCTPAAAGELEPFRRLPARFNLPGWQRGAPLPQPCGSWLAAAPALL